MKNIYLWVLAIILVSTIACNSSKEKTRINEKLVISANLPFEGIWSRSFELGKDSIAHVYYRVWKDSIQYEMQGPLKVKYIMHKDTFISNDNRWVGKLNDVSYVIFLKNITKDSIVLFKKEVKNKSEAIQMNFPSKEEKSHFSSWNTYYKKNK